MIHLKKRDNIRSWLNARCKYLLFLHSIYYQQSFSPLYIYESMLSKEIHFYEHLLIRYESLLLISKLYSFISHYYFLVCAFAELNLKKYVPTTRLF